MDDKYVYVFVRQDLPLAEQLVHASHAAFHAGVGLPEGGIPSIVMVGVPHPAALTRVLKKLQDANLPHSVWNDPDLNAGDLAIATKPLTKEQKTALANYRLWKHSGETVQAVDVGSSPTPAAMPS